MNNNKKVNQKYALKKVLAYIGKYKVWIFLSILFAAVTVALSLYLPILIGRAIDLIVGKNNVDFDNILKILTESAVIIGVNAILQWFMNTINNRVTFQVVRDGANRYRREGDSEAL